MARIPAQGTLNQAEQAVRSAVQNPWVERLARFGYAARGVVYALIGLLAIQAAFGGRGAIEEQATPQGALQRIAEQSRLLLVLVAIGLIGYALWRFVQAVLDTENKGGDSKGLVKRGAMLASGIGYAGLALLAARMVSGSSSGGGGGGSQGAAAAGLMDKPFGRWLVILAGIGVIVSAAYQLYEAYTKKFRKRLKLEEMSADEERLATHTGQAGLAARGIAFLVSGWFLIKSGLQYDPNEARGLGGALASLASQSYGPWLLGLVALGFIAYGAYSFLQARYRKIVF
ncbi:MAG TPA: DUF1206 domain-containing protein [Thermoanaerobaculia bacterium]|jgi:hypothetical protein|nr:DUF1206 domain-containing protein [Thermoanaerobaculia bacterium]